MHRPLITLVLALSLVIGATVVAGEGPKGGPPFNTYVCTGALQITTAAGTTTENWNETLFFYKDGKKKRFSTTEWLGKWWKKKNGSSDWKWSANISHEMEKFVEFSEPGVNATVVYKFRKMKVKDGVLTGVIKGWIKRKYPDGTETLETHQGTFSGVGS